MSNGRHIVVTGYSRSGTTMFYNMLRYAVDNFEFFDHECAAASVVNRAGNFISKRPLDLFSISELGKANVNNKKVDIIVLIRDIRSILTSRHRHVADDYFIAHDKQYFIHPAKGNFYTNPGVIDTHNAICKLFFYGFIDDIKIIRYEDLVIDPNRVQSLLVSSFGLRCNRKFSDFHKGNIPEGLRAPMHSVRKVDTSRLEGWKDAKHRRRVISQFSRCEKLFDILVQYGYEIDRSWFDSIKSSKGS